MNKFGIEIEFVGMGNNNRSIGSCLYSKVNDAEFRLDGPQINFAWGNNGYEQNNWSVKGDSSVHTYCERNVSLENYFANCGVCATCRNPGGAELVSPPLPYTQKSLTDVYRVLEAMKACGAKANSTCGIHIHIDTTWLRNLPSRTSSEFLGFMFNAYSESEDVFDSYVDVSRRENRNNYCRTHKNVQWHSELDRYFKLNTSAYLRHGTIEFRQHHGSLDSKEVCDWIHMCMAFYRAKVLEFFVAKNLPSEQFPQEAAYGS